MVLGSTVINFSGTKTLVVAVLFNILVRYILYSVSHIFLNFDPNGKPYLFPYQA